MKFKTPSEEYLEKARQLPDETIERLLARMRSKVTRKLEEEKIDTIEALAIQLELEDQQLEEWRSKMAEIRKKHKG